MTLLSRAGRALMGWMFVHSGQRVLRTPGPATALSAPSLAALRRVLPVMPNDDVMIVRANAVLHVAAGSALLSDRFSRPASLVLALSLVPTTAAGHAFWTADEPAQRRAQRAHFDKNVAILGGLLATAAARPVAGRRWSGRSPH